MLHYIEATRYIYMYIIFSCLASYFVVDNDYGPTNLSALNGISCPRDSDNVTSCTIRPLPTYQYQSCLHSNRLGVVCERGKGHHTNTTISGMQLYNKKRVQYGKGYHTLIGNSDIK